MVQQQHKRPASQHNVLLVEGFSEQRVLPHLLESNGVQWPKEAPPVFIDFAEEAVQWLLNPKTLSGYWKEEQTHRLGVVIDADIDGQGGSNAAGRYARLRAISPFAGVAWPDKIPETGLTLDADGKRFGVWIMPNNSSKGMLETFLQCLVAPDYEKLWRHCEKLPAEARNHGANFKEAHADKARIHAFLAFRDEPGRQLHQAIQEGLLQSESEQAQPFVAWFKRLFELP